MDKKYLSGKEEQYVKDLLESFAGFLERSYEDREKMDFKDEAEMIMGYIGTKLFMDVFSQGVVE